MNHAAMAGEHVTSLGGHPSLNIGKLVESHKHESTQFSTRPRSTNAPRCRNPTTCSRSLRTNGVWLEEYAREQIRLEEQHMDHLSSEKRIALKDRRGREDDAQAG